MRAIGFPFDRGRLDESEHPFTEGVSGDIRITTRLTTPMCFGPARRHARNWARDVRPWTASGLAGPAGRTRPWHGARGSQSLLLEMLVGRSRAFVTYLRPLLKSTSPSADGMGRGEPVPPAHPCAAQPDRVDADELTYPLHILLRYDLEKRLLSGELKVRELPQAWSDGWSSGSRCARPARPTVACRTSIGRSDPSVIFRPMCWRVIAAQLWESLRTSVPGLDEQISRGEFAACSAGCVKTCMRRCQGSGQRAHEAGHWTAALGRGAAAPPGE